MLCCGRGKKSADEVEADKKVAERGRDLTFEEALNKRDVQLIDAAVENVAKRTKCESSAPNITKAALTPGQEAGRDSTVEGEAEPQEVDEKIAYEQPDDEGEKLEQETEHNAMLEDQLEAGVNTCNEGRVLDERKDGNWQFAST